MDRNRNFIGGYAPSILSQPYFPKKKGWEIPWEKERIIDYCIRTGAPCVYCTRQDCENRVAELDRPLERRFKEQQEALRNEQEA